MRIPLSYQFTRSEFLVLASVLLGVVLIKMALCIPESVAFVELIHGSFKCANVCSGSLPRGKAAGA